MIHPALTHLAAFLLGAVCGAAALLYKIFGK